MRVLILEDEHLAAERMEFLLRELRPDVEIVACLKRIDETIEWLMANPEPDLLVMDVELSDGLVFDLFRKFRVNVPVIFTSENVQYAMDAFRVMGIDYLLKPVTVDSLSAALEKLNRLKGAAGPKSRFLARIGKRSYLIDASEVVYFSADNKIVYLFAHDGLRYIVDQTLESLEKTLDPRLFFRLNRSVIVRASAIELVRPYVNSRLKLKVKAGKVMDELIVSRGRVPAFREWAEG